MKQRAVGSLIRGLFRLGVVIEDISSVSSEDPEDSEAYNEEHLTTYRNQIRDLFKQCPTWLAKRLALANTQRFCRLVRMRNDALRFQEEQKRRIEDQYFNTDSGYGTATTGRQSRLLSVPALTSGSLSMATWDSELETKPPGQRLPLNPVVPVVKRTQMMRLRSVSPAWSHDQQTQYSFATEIDLDETPETSRLRFPPAPEQNADKTYDCPACGQNFAWSPFSLKKAWQTHLMRDLQPYVCPMWDCIIPEHTFESQGAWINHIRSVHPEVKRYQCSTPQCAAAYLSLDDLADHMEVQHGVSAGAVPFMRYQTIRQPVEQEASCFMCNQPRPERSSVVTHLAKHMIQVAVKVVPRLSTQDEACSNQSIDLSSQDGIDDARPGETPTETTMLSGLSSQIQIDKESSAQAAVPATRTEEQDQLLPVATSKQRIPLPIANRHPLYQALMTDDQSSLAEILEVGVDINAELENYGSLLQAAVSVSSVNKIRFLLHRGANVNLQRGNFSTALQAACKKSRTEVVALLLDHGADVEIRGVEHVSTLYVASSQGDEAVVKLLLDAGANVNAQGGPHGNALQAAVFRNSEAIVKLLLDAGAEVNAQGGPNGNALQAAVFRNSEAIVKLLLDAGANVNAQGGPHGNALQAAVFGNSEAIVKLLLDAGAEVNAQGGPNGNALQAAVFGNSKAVVRLLLDAGAIIDD